VKIQSSSTVKGTGTGRKETLEVVRLGYALSMDTIL
jgi:hypothetical protein